MCNTFPASGDKIMATAFPPTLREKDLGIIQCGHFTEAQCRKIIDFKTNDKNIKKSGRVNNENQKVVDLKKRDVDVWVIHEDNLFEGMPIDEMMCVLGLNANQQFDFNVSGLMERPQLLCYHDGSKGYDWHTDTGTGDASTRKISVSVILNDGYEGGELAFFDDGQQMMKADAGVAVAFPSFVPHKVMPVTKGVRWSLVAWFSGEPFR
jgi:PKHD-type hydroxylase